MTSRNRNLALAAGAVVALALIMWNVVPEPSAVTASPVHSPAPGVASPTASTTPPPLESSLAEEPATALRSYSIGLHELSGITPDIPPGTHIEIWASWDPSVSKEPQIQRLLKDVVIERIDPPFLPEGPTAVVLALAPHQVKNMLWGDKYGDLAAVVIE